MTPANGSSSPQLLPSHPPSFSHSLPAASHSNGTAHSQDKPPVEELIDSPQLLEFMDFLARSKDVTDGAFPQRLLKEEVEPAMQCVNSRRLRSKLMDAAIGGTLCAQPIGFCGVSYVKSFSCVIVCDIDNVTKYLSFPFLFQPHCAILAIFFAGFHLFPSGIVVNVAYVGAPLLLRGRCVQVKQETGLRLMRCVGRD